MCFKLKRLTEFALCVCVSVCVTDKRKDTGQRDNVKEKRCERNKECVGHKDMLSTFCTFLLLCLQLLLYLF